MSPSDLVAFVDDGLGNSSYLVDLGDGRGLVVDPARHPGRYLAEADRRALKISHAVETHLHADFVSGSRELAALGASLLVPRAGGHEFPVTGLVDDEEIELGGLTLRALATPGHTPEHLSYLLLDGSAPVALFSGGSLLVDSVARTDLISPEQTDALARSLWRSIQTRILTLPDDLAVYPTHGAGSFCSAPASGERTTTVGRERHANPLLAAADEDAFVDALLAGLGTYPPYFSRLREVNRRGPHLHGPGQPALASVSVDDVDRLQSAGAWVVDVRPVEAFAAGHVPGSVSIALRPQFRSWLGWIVPDGAPVVFVVDPGQDRSELVMQARDIGYETLLGELRGGIEGWRDAGRPVVATEIVTAEDLRGTVVDVRQRDEYLSGHIPGSVHAELGSLVDAELPGDALSVMCGHGERAMTGASLLERAGRPDVTVVVGGPADWAGSSRRLATGS